MNTNINTKRILCYGDSLTWGYIPNTGHERFPVDERWTGILQQSLGDKFEIIEEGLNSRTLNSDDQRIGKEGRNGSTYLIPCLDTHDPLDLVVIMLGTNELKDSFDTPIDKLETILENFYIKIVLDRKSQFRGTVPQLLLVCPPPIDISKEYAKSRYSQSKNKYKALVEIYKKLATKYKLPLVESNKSVITGDDGVHMTKTSHKDLATKLLGIIQNLPL